MAPDFNKFLEKMPVKFFSFALLGCSLAIRLKTLNFGSRESALLFLAKRKMLHWYTQSKSI